jgi:hypothetical protein
VVAQNLTRQANAGERACRESFFLGCGHACRLTLDELHAAGGTSRETTTRVHDVDVSVRFNGAHEPTAR